MSSSTIGSSMPYQTALDWSVPSTYASQLRNDLDELQTYRAQAPDPDELQRLRAELERLRAEQRVPDDPAKVEAMKARALHAGAIKVSDLHAVMDAAIERYRPQLPMTLWKSRRSRADWLVKQMKDPPHWRTIDAYLNTLHI